MNTINLARMQIFLLILTFLLVFGATPVPVSAGTVPPKDANHMVMEEVLLGDLAQLGALVGEDPSKQIPWSGYITDSSWTLSVFAAPYRDGTVSIQYVGNYDPTQDVITWSGTVSFTNGVGTVSWSSEGSYTDATKDGLFSWIKKAAKWVAHNETLIDIIEYGAQTLTTVLSGGSLGPAATMVSNIVDRIQEGASIVHEGIETFEIVKSWFGGVNAKTTRQGGPVPVSFREPGLVVAESPNIEVISKALISGNYANEAVTVEGQATVDSTICLSASFPVKQDTYICGTPPEKQDDNYGMQEFIAAGGGGYAGPGPLAHVQLDIPEFLKGHSPSQAYLTLTVHGFEGGWSGAIHSICTAHVYEPWVEGNGFEGDPKLRPPGATDPDSAYGLDWLTRPGFEFESTRCAMVKQGVAKPGDMVRLDIKPNVDVWTYGGECVSCGNYGLYLFGNIQNAAVRFGAREGKLYNIPGAVNGPSLRMQWIAKGDFDGDGDIDRKDLEQLLKWLGPVTDGTLAADLDKDGIVSALDARRLQRCCSRPNCATD